MKLNLKLLAENLRQKEDEPPASEAYVNPYLLNHVLRPAMDGADIVMGDIDYTAFDQEDELVSMYEYVNGLNQGCS